jgi:hypothetical protein
MGGSPVDRERKSKISTLVSEQRRRVGISKKTQQGPVVNQICGKETNRPEQRCRRQQQTQQQESQQAAKQLGDSCGVVGGDVMQRKG